MGSTNQNTYDTQISTSSKSNITTILKGASYVDHHHPNDDARYPNVCP